MQDRRTHQGDQLLKDVFARPLGGVQDGGQGGISLRAPVRAKTAQHFAVDHRRSQGPFASVVVGRHISAMQKEQQMRPVCSVAIPQIRAEPTTDPSVVPGWSPVFDIPVGSTSPAVCPDASLPGTGLASPGPNSGADVCRSSLARPVPFGRLRAGSDAASTIGAGQQARSVAAPSNRSPRLRPGTRS